MNQCPSCKTSVEPNAKFCPKCKTAISKVTDKEKADEEQKRLLEEKLRSLGYL